MSRLRFFLAAMALLVPAAALAHAVVFPKASTVGAYEKYVIRVPNERDIPTTSIQITFPREITVVSFAEVPGWRLTPVENARGRVTGAIWEGELGVARFVELPFVAVNPDEATTLTWPVSQTYANGERVDWNGPEGSETPASTTAIGTGDPAAPSAVPLWLSVAALVLALVSLGLALRPRGR